MLADLMCPPLSPYLSLSLPLSLPLFLLGKHFLAAVSGMGVELPVGVVAHEGWDD